MIQVSISDFIAITAGVFSLFGVYVALNNRILKNSESIQVLRDELKKEQDHSTKLADVIAGNYKEFSKALHENSIAITELKTILSKMSEK